MQAPDFSQNFNRYSYALDNPLKFTDPTGKWFGIDDAIVAGASFVIGYVSHGVSTGNWGAAALKAGGISAVSSWLAYNTGGASGAISKKTWGFIGNTAINAAVNQFIPPVTIPVSNNFSISASPAVRFGTNGLSAGINYSVNYSNGDFALSAGFGASTNFRGWNVSATYDGWGGGFGKTYYDASKVMGQKFDSQTVGTFTAYFNHNSFALSNDAFGDGKDRWRTNAFELSVGNFTLGSYIYTN